MTSPSTNGVKVQLIALARLLEYPGVDFEERLRSGVSAERRHSSPASSAALCRDAATSKLHQFTAAMQAISSDEREELYTATFDVTPACVAYVSIHLFGEENFKRGEFMAGLYERYAQAGFSTSGELPDHLSILLRFVAETNEAERRELTEFCLLGPLGKMIAALAETNPYRALLEAVREVLKAAFPDMKPALSPLEQMQQHGGACAAIASGCACGTAGMEGEGAEPRIQRAPQLTEELAR